MIWALRLAWEAARGRTLVVAALHVLGAVLPLVGLWLMKLLVDTVVARAGGSAGSESGFLALLGWAGGVALLSALVRETLAVQSEAQTQRVTLHVQSRLQEQAMALSLAHLEDPPTLDLLHRAQSEGVSRPARALTGLNMLLGSSISLVAVGGLLVFLDPLLGGLALASAVPAAFVRRLLARDLRALREKSAPAEREAGYLGGLMLAAGAAKEVRLFGLAPWLTTKWRNLRVHLDRERLDLSSRRARRAFFAQIGTQSALFLAYGWLGLSAFRGRISIGEFVLYAQGIQRAQGALQGLVHAALGLDEDRVFLEGLQKFLALPAEEPRGLPATASARVPFDAVRLEGVSFRYPQATELALDRIDLEIRRGDTVAVVGSNGAGKSTLIKLLCRLYEPTSGRVLVDGRPVAELSPSEWRSHESAIFQDFGRYELTARDNLQLGGEASAMDQRAWEVTGVTELLARLPKGVDSMLGRRFAGGTELSQGQWQSLALARALSRPADLVVLDEPTAALDPIREGRWLQSLPEWSRDRALVLVTHRSRVALACRRVIVIERGRVVEEGEPQLLAKSSGPFAQWLGSAAA